MGELLIKIKPDGSIEIDAVGYSGNSCLEASKPYEKDLGVTLSREKKPEILSGEGVKTDATTRNRARY